MLDCCPAAYDAHLGCSSVEIHQLDHERASVGALAIDILSIPMHRLYYDHVFHTILALLAADR